MYRVAPGRKIQHNGTIYGPGMVVLFAPSPELIADGACVKDPETAKPAPRRRRRKRVIK